MYCIVYIWYVGVCRYYVIFDLKIILFELSSSISTMAMVRSKHSLNFHPLNMNRAIGMAQQKIIKLNIEWNVHNLFSVSLPYTIEYTHSFRQHIFRQMDEKIYRQSTPDQILMILNLVNKKKKKIRTSGHMNEFMLYIPTLSFYLNHSLYHILTN